MHLQLACKLPLLIRGRFALLANDPRVIDNGLGLFLDGLILLVVEPRVLDFLGGQLIEHFDQL